MGEGKMGIRHTLWKVIGSIVISIVLSIILTRNLIFQRRCGGDVKGILGACPGWTIKTAIMIDLILFLFAFILIYLIWSLIQKKEKSTNRRQINWSLILTLVFFFVGLYSIVSEIVGTSNWLFNGDFRYNNLKSSFVELFFVILSRTLLSSIFMLIPLAILFFFIYGSLKLISKVEFLKPNLKKILVMVGIAFPAIFGLAGIFFRFNLLPPKFLFLNEWIIISGAFYGIFASLIFTPIIMFCGLESCPSYIFLFAQIFSCVIGMLIGYILSSLIVFVWDKLFSYFGRTGKLFKIIIPLAFLILLLILLILFPIVSYSFVHVEKTAAAEIVREKLAGGGDLRLQELIIRNNFIYPIDYQLPSVTICIYDTEGNLNVRGYDIGYRYNDGGFVEDVDKFQRNVVFIKPGKEIKIYLQRFGTGISNSWNDPAIDVYKRESDELLLLENVGFNNKDYCSNIKEKDIDKAEKIKIVDNLSEEYFSEETDYQLNLEKRVIPLRDEAIAKNDVNICDEIMKIREEETKKIEATPEPSETSKGSHGNFFIASDVGKSNYNICIENISVALNNESLCEKLGGKYGIEECIKKVLYEHFEPCKSISEDELKLNCIKEFAYETNNSQLCQKIGEDNCIRSIALKTRNISMCDEMIDGGWKGDCVYDIMLILKDPTLCDTIKDIFSKRRCKGAIGLS